jgi:hypothetical protein
MALSILYRLCLTPNFDGRDKGFPSLSTGAATHMSPRQWANGAMICAIPNRHLRGRRGTWAMIEELSQNIESLARVEQVCQEVRL